MKYIEGVDRSQLSYLPECLEDYIQEDNPIKIIDVFVDGLNLDKLGFNKIALKDKGRPPYHPKTLLKLYIYGYMNKVIITPE
jgi:transposase